MRFGGLLRSATAALTVALAIFVGAIPAFAQPYPGGGETPPVVGGEKFFRGGTARTGSDVLLLILLGLLILLVGLVLYRLSRREAPREG